MPPPPPRTFWSGCSDGTLEVDCIRRTKSAKCPKRNSTPYPIIVTTAAHSGVSSKSSCSSSRASPPPFPSAGAPPSTPLQPPPWGEHRRGGGGGQGERVRGHGMRAPHLAGLGGLPGPTCGHHSVGQSVLRTPIAISSKEAFVATGGTPRQVPHGPLPGSASGTSARHGRGRTAGGIGSLSGRCKPKAGDGGGSIARIGARVAGVVRRIDDGLRSLPPALAAAGNPGAPRARGRFLD